MTVRGPKPKTTLFTDANVLTLPAPPDGAPLIYRDEAIAGLILRVSKTGVRSYATETRDARGGKRHQALGFAPADKLPDIRMAAVTALGKQKVALRRETARGSGKTLEAVMTDYLADKGIHPDNGRRYKSVLRTYGWPFWTKPISAITRDEVQQQRILVRDGKFPRPPESAAQGGPGMANDFIEYGSMVVSWLLGRKADNPFKDHDPYETPAPADRYVIHPRDWGRIASVVRRWDSDDQDLFWLHIMLGARPIGTSRMRWDRVLWEKRAYRLTRDREECQGWKPAQAAAWDYPLDSFTMELLRDRKQLADDRATYVFPSPQRRHDGASITDAPLTRLFKDLREKLALPSNCTPYAGRYTRGTYSDALFGSGYLTAAMLNHVLVHGQSQTAKYTVIDSRDEESFGYSQIRKSVERYSQAIRELAGLLPLTEEVEKKLLA